ncbi:MAG: hypothetical protein JJU31_10335 [Wenzhouxiangella sp.]|nr:hypothetical protein [Wenzhouxiangella sp.]TVR97152.1 MAG: hypothetical protein EA418_03725 [Wenzhouxiangellaceae bacterium]
MNRGFLPLGLKIAFTLWVMLWAVSYARILGPQNFFWLCNLANFLILVGLWLDHRLLLSMQWLAVALVGLLWGLDLGVAAATGWHPFGGTAYMFDPEFPELTRWLSFYHLLLPLVSGFAVWRLGYDARALRYQGLLTILVVGLSFWLTDPDRNINWVYAPFGMDQAPIPTALYLPALALGWVLLVLWPVHWPSKRLMAYSETT